MSPQFQWTPNAARAGISRRRQAGRGLDHTKDRTCYEVIAKRKTGNPIDVRQTSQGAGNDRSRRSARLAVETADVGGDAVGGLDQRLDRELAVVALGDFGTACEVGQPVGTHRAGGALQRVRSLVPVLC